MNEKQKQLVASMLKDFSSVLGNRRCNDWSFPEDWTYDERLNFCKDYHEWNGDPEEFIEENLRLPDFAVAAYLAHLMVSDEPDQA